jgi:hypothetical protein
MENPENRPVLDYEAVMVGDRLDLTSTRAPKKMALLNPPNEAKQLMKEGEQNLQMLVNSKSTRKIASVEPVTSKKQKLAKKSVPQKKK